LEADAEEGVGLPKKGNAGPRRSMELLNGTARKEKKDTYVRLYIY
jgi:hypothetical protein